MSVTPRFRTGRLALSLARSLAAAALPALAVSPLAFGPALAQQQGFPIIVDLPGFEALVSQGAKVIDVRSPALFEQGHIPGAVNLPTSLLNVGEIDGIRNELPSDEALIAALRGAGIDDGDLIVIYDQGALPGRAFIALDYAGLTVHVLQDGFGTWTGAQETGPVDVAQGSFSLANPRDIFVTQEEVAAASAGTTIIDGRSEESYEDGHIPGALSLSTAFFSQVGTSQSSAPAVIQTLASRGIPLDQEIISYCGSGVAAANNYLALRNLGYQKVSLYDGSWDEWSRDPAAGQSLALGNFTFGTDAEAQIPGAPRLLELADVQSLLGDPGVVILDVRNTGDFRAGHIPGAVNVYWNTTLDENRVLLPLADLQALYAEAGVTPDKRVVLFSRGGVQLTHTYTVLQLLGFTNVDLFSGYFEGWAV